MADAGVAGGGGLGALPSDSGLPAGREEAFRRERARIAAHHRAWRRAMPGLDALFDDHGHRAHALAGNLATEFADVLAAWRRAVGGEPAGQRVAAFAAAWREAALDQLRRQAWAAEAESAFVAVLDELMGRAIAAAGEASGRRPGASGRRLLPVRWRALAWRLTGPLWRFFRPAG